MLGNYEYMAYSVLKKFNVEITAYNYNSHLDAETIEMYENWMFNVGITSSQQFAKLSKEQRDSIIEYLSEFESVEELKVNGMEFILVHDGLANFCHGKDLYDYDIHEMIWGRYT